MAENEIRRAVPDDARAIAEVQVRGWQDAYRHLIPAERLDALDPAARADRWREIVAAETEVTWVAVLANRVVGWATTSDRTLDEHPRDLELNGLYVLSDVYGAGVGQDLLDSAIGGRPAVLWTASDNPRAQSFYRKNGFTPDGVIDEYELLGTPVAIERWTR